MWIWGTLSQQFYNCVHSSTLFLSPSTWKSLACPLFAGFASRRRLWRLRCAEDSDLFSASAPSLHANETPHHAPSYKLDPGNQDWARDQNQQLHLWYFLQVGESDSLPPLGESLGCKQRDIDRTEDPKQRHQRFLNAKYFLTQSPTLPIVPFSRLSRLEQQWFHGHIVLSSLHTDCSRTGLVLRNISAMVSWATVRKRVDNQLCNILSSTAASSCWFIFFGNTKFLPSSCAVLSLFGRGRFHEGSQQHLVITLLRPTSPYRPIPPGGLHQSQ